MRKIIKIFDGVLTLGGYATAFLVVLVTILLLYEVCTRYFLRSPSVWSLDIVRYTIFFLTFTGAAWLLREEGHVKVELITDFLTPKGKALMDGVTSAIAFLACCIYCWEGAKLSWTAYHEGHVIERAIIVPRYLVEGIVPLGVFLLCLQFARRTWAAFSHFQTLNQK